MKDLVEVNDNEFIATPVEWLGKYPRHWDLIRNKDLFEERGEVSLDGSETLLTVSHITGVTPRSEKNVNMFMAESNEGYKICKSGDFIINTMWAWMGALGTTKDDGICSPAYGVYKPKNQTPYYPKYFDYLYRTPCAIREMARNSKGIVASRLRLYPKEFFQIITALPPLDEQILISDYLDHKIRLINEEILSLEDKEKTYKKLKQSLIDEVTLKGLSSSLETSECEIPGVGHAPSSWKIFRLKELGYLYSGLSGKAGEDFTKDSEFSAPYIPFTNIAKNFYLDTDQVDFVVVSPNETQNTIKQNDMFFLMSSEDYDDVGRCSLLKDKVPTTTFLNSFCKGFRFTDKKINPRFINYLLHTTAYRTNLSIEGKGFTRINLKMEKVNDIRVLVPSPDEQLQIADYLDEKVTKIDKIREQILLLLEKFKELRGALIRDLVSGSLKISNGEKK